MKIIFLITALFFILSMNFANAVNHEKFKAKLLGAGGENHGLVELLSTPNGVLLDAKLKGISEGSHGFHIHSVGKCEPPFKTAGGHFNPTNAEHGIPVSGGHAGDMPNIHVPSSGKLRVEILNTKVSLKKGTSNDISGVSIIIHAKDDDYQSQPSGAAGSRIACGVITQ